VVVKGTPPTRGANRPNDQLRACQQPARAQARTRENYHVRGLDFLLLRPRLGLLRCPSLVHKCKSTFVDRVHFDDQWGRCVTANTERPDTTQCFFFKKKFYFSVLSLGHRTSYERKQIHVRKSIHRRLQVGKEDVEEGKVRVGKCESF